MTRPGLLNPEKRGDDVDQSIRPLAIYELAGLHMLTRQRLKELAK